MIVANAISEGVTAENVEELLALAVEQQILFHGVKRATFLPGVRERGVEPLTPEGGPASYWATGSQLFYDRLPNPDASDWAYNTAFFHYGHTYDPSGRFLMALAITEPKRLAQRKIVPHGLKEHGECTVIETVDPSLLTLVTVESAERSQTRKAMFDFLLKGMRSRRLLEVGHHDVRA